jgi:hypothetical protein
MTAPDRRLSPRPRIRILLLLLNIGAAAGLLFTLLHRPAPLAAPTPSLADRAQEGTWQVPAVTTTLANPLGYRESDFLAIDGKYYLFSTSSEDPAWVDVYVGQTPEELVNSPPLFTHVAPIRYPTVVKIGNTWHMWGVNPPHHWTEHWISNNADPTGFVYSDSPFRGSSVLPVVDFAVRQYVPTGDWYGVGFETEDNAPLLLTRASTPYGPWEKLNYVPNAHAGGIFGDSGPPSWATAARFDPNLVFTPDGRAWTLFTGRATTPTPSPNPLDLSGIVEVDLATGKALDDPVVLFDPRLHLDLPFRLVADLNLVSLPGQPDRIFGYTDTPSSPLAYLDFASLLDGGD